MSGKLSKSASAMMLSFALTSQALAPTAAFAQERPRSATATFSAGYSEGDMRDVASYGSDIGCAVTIKRGVSPVGPIRLSAPGPKIGAAMSVPQAQEWLDHNC